MYRIYTEQKNTRKILKIVSEHVNGFTVFQDIGYWKGKPEKSIVIEIEEIEFGCKTMVEDIARGIKILNDQESVLIVHIQSEFFYI